MVSDKTYRTIKGFCPIHKKDVYIKVKYLLKFDYSLHPIGFSCELYNNDDTYSKTCSDCPIYQETKLKYLISKR